MKLSADFPVSMVCNALGLPRSSFYYRSQRANEVEVRTAIKQEAETWPRYGYRRITQELRRKGWRINEKRVRRLMQEMSLQVKKKRSGKCTTNSRHEFGRFPNLIRDRMIEKPDQVWAADVTYVRLKWEYVYLAVIMDLFTRGIRGWHLSHRLDHSLTLTALKKAMASSKPEIHHSDQGVQYAATRYVRLLKDAGIQISMSDVGQPTQNPHVERLIRTIKEEEVYLSEYDDCQEAREQIGRFIEDVYMYKRIHSSLGYLTPVEYELQWQSILVAEAMDVI